MEQGHPQRLVGRRYDDPLPEWSAVWSAHFADAVVDQVIHSALRQLDPQVLVGGHGDELIFDPQTPETEDGSLMDTIDDEEFGGTVPEQCVGFVHRWIVCRPAWLPAVSGQCASLPQYRANLVSYE